MSDLLKERENILNRLSSKYNQWVMSMKSKEEDRKAQFQILSSPEAQTDKSENHIYLAAKEKVMQLNAEIKTLSDKQDAYRDFASQEYKPSDTICIGSVIRIELLRDNREFIICLVPEGLGSASIGAVPINCPVGSVIIGKRAGDEVTVRSLSGLLVYRIKEVY